MLSIVIMSVDHRQGHLKLVRAALSTLVYPLHYAVNAPMKIGRWMSDSLVTRQTLMEENERLLEEQRELNLKVQRFQILEEENRRLRELLGSSANFEERVLVAEMLAVELEPLRHLIEINKGIQQGAYNGQPIVDANGIVGQIIHAGLFSSKVLLITDPSHALPVQVNRNGLRAIIVGTGQSDSLKLEHLPTNSDIQVGDLIVSSGLGQRFPKGYSVGTVSKITIEPGEPFAKVAVTPSAKLSQNHEVLLIWPQNREESEDSNTTAEMEAHENE